MRLLKDVSEAIDGIEKQMLLLSDSGETEEFS